MTINSTTRTAGPFTGNGVTTIFPFTFKVFARTDVLVAITNATTFVETVLTLDSDYGVTLNADQNASPGGTITMTVPPPVGTTLAATSNIPLLQKTDLTNQGGFYPRVISDALDKITIQIQQLASKVGIGLNVGGAAAFTAILNFISNMASAAGSSLIGFLQAGTGAVLRTVQSKLRDTVSVKDFGAKGDGVTDDTAAIQAAIDSLGTSGGYVDFPPATYLCSSTLTMRAKVTLRGRGCAASVLTWATTGDGIKMTSAVNSSTAVNTTVENLGLTCTNGANTGGGYVDVGGSYVRLRNVAVNGFKYNVIFDQTEIASISECQLTGAITGGVWLTNGADHSPGGAIQFTNRITIEKNQFNLCPNHIIDDGGYVHDIKNNNFNGGATQIRVAGGFNISIDTNEFESATNCCVQLAGSTFNSGAGVGGCNVTIRANTLVPGAGAAVNISSASGHVVTSLANVYTGSASAKIIGIGLNTGSFAGIGDSCISGPYTDIEPTSGAPAAILVCGSAVYVQKSTTAPLVAYKADFTGGGQEQSKFDLQANNNSSARVTYAGLSCAITGNGAGSESGALNLKTVSAGAYATKWSVLAAGTLQPFTDNTTSAGSATNRISVVYAGTGAINTSDARAKVLRVPDEREMSPVGAIDPALLRSIRRVNFAQFKFRDAVAQKGDGARWHFGVIAQQVKAAFEAEGLDPFSYGVLCYDEWDDQYESVMARRPLLDREGKPVLAEDGSPVVEEYDTGEKRLARAAGNRYGVRHDELFALKFAALDAD